MPVANNSAELEKMIMDQVQKAMQATQVKIKADMLKETQNSVLLVDKNQLKN